MRSLTAFILSLLMILPIASAARAEIAPAGRQTVELVPAVRRGHSTMWKTGAIITVTSIGVSLVGAALTIQGLGNNPFEHASDFNGGLFWGGIAMSIVGDAGLVIAGPALWIAGANYARQ